MSMFQIKPSIMAMEEYSLSRQKSDFAEALPSPLPRERKRALTPPPAEQCKKDNPSQPQSWLLVKLPAEIRLMIWEYAIGGQKIHIVSKYRRLGHVICTPEYWEENRCKRPGLRASSYMLTYGSLPSTKQLADWNMCNLLRACRQIYTEAITILYETNIFVFWDLRVIRIFHDGILPERWQAIRSIEIYAMFYRNEDINDACEASSSLQLHAWPTVCSSLKTLLNLRGLRVFIANPFYLDKQYLSGHRTGLYQAVAAFLKGCKGIEVQGGLEIFLPVKRRGTKRDESHWNHCCIKDELVMALEVELRKAGMDCRTFIGDNISSKEEIEQKSQIQGYK
ncbi:hypothetical protein K469DRAFT_751787 [Zopfia rhizophila CBS 207.26]|uniref:DUF7730 domain-containing protein n=1 Tax=Zopfia rhizophila CBS 207.26 TaxID=1314779 RepID=A0A6A6DY82_9PEZI|nr:hypothetical protein K469DRAFT_751787 [Zopfia rhizophila CBS 207.26]